MDETLKLILAEIKDLKTEIRLIKMCIVNDYNPKQVESDCDALALNKRLFLVESDIEQLKNKLKLN